MGSAGVGVAMLVGCTVGIAVGTAVGVSAGVGVMVGTTVCTVTIANVGVTTFMGVGVITEMVGVASRFLELTKSVDNLPPSILFFCGLSRIDNSISFSVSCGWSGFFSNTK
ncbi:MAG: hypothetical protein COU63_02220 [Candidatus Pacebacteria bacterium CG10_big_fil_rev_8_21_14_0_10_36_11]|nr:MAG: hypothetical protein COU63_02220 [Candidatus Pacebacteria bacterium CG10_big_fil_rev_8_21_14_0_10_36_11]